MSYQPPGRQQLGSPSPSSSPEARLHSLNGHLAPQMSFSSTISLAPADPLFSLISAYKADTFDKKVDLGVGAYRDDNAKPWVLPVVKKVAPAPAHLGVWGLQLTRRSGGRNSSRRPRPEPRIPPHRRPARLHVGRCPVDAGGR